MGKCKCFESLYSGNLEEEDQEFLDKKFGKLKEKRCPECQDFKRVFGEYPPRCIVCVDENGHVKSE